MRILSLCNLFLKGYWLEKKNQLAFIEYATKQLGIKDLEDWYEVSRYQIIEVRTT